MSDFHGLSTRLLANEHLQLEFLAEAGPRIVRLTAPGSQGNLLAETPAVKWDTPYGEYFLRGGHRLWHAPEAMPRTYVPDNSGLEIEELEGGVRLRQPVEAPTGIRKSMEVRLHADRPAVTLCHALYNDGLWPVELAPWAITQLRLGGLAILPQPAAPLDEAGLLPNRRLALWPYTRWGDARLHVCDDFVFVEGQPQAQACKIGCMNRLGWLGYLHGGVLFVKRFQPQPDEPHADLGCNAEIYCKDVCLELETLGPLRRLAPGQRAEHIETWEIYTRLDAPQTPDGVRSLARSLNL